MALTGHPTDEPLPESWQNRKVVAAALWDVARDFEEHADEWANTTVPDYLEALSALLASIEHAYANSDEALPDDPWIVLAAAVRSARYHE